MVSRGVLYRLSQNYRPCSILGAMRLRSEKDDCGILIWKWGSLISTWTNTFFSLKRWRVDEPGRLKIFFVLLKNYKTRPACSKRTNVVICYVFNCPMCCWLESVPKSFCAEGSEGPDRLSYIVFDVAAVSLANESAVLITFSPVDSSFIISWLVQKLTKT